MKDQNRMKIRIGFFGYRSSLGKAIEKVWIFEKYKKQGSGCEPEQGQIIKGSFNVYVDKMNNMIGDQTNLKRVDFACIT